MTVPPTPLSQVPKVEHFLTYFGTGEVEGKRLVLDGGKESENKCEMSSPGISIYSILCDFTLSLHMVSLS